MDTLFKHWDKTGEWLSTKECADMVGMRRQIIYQNLVRYERAGLIHRGYEVDTSGRRHLVAVWKKA